MELMDPTRFVFHVFRITRLDTVFQIVLGRSRWLAQIVESVGRSSFNF